MVYHGLPFLIAWWIFPWQTVSHNQMVTFKLEKNKKKWWLFVPWKLQRCSMKLSCSSMENPWNLIMHFFHKKKHRCHSHQKNSCSHPVGRLKSSQLCEGGHGLLHVTQRRILLLGPCWFQRFHPHGYGNSLGKCLGDELGLFIVCSRCGEHLEIILR